jgi:hypothetical protein
MKKEKLEPKKHSTNISFVLLWNRSRDGTQGMNIFAKSWFGFPLLTALALAGCVLSRSRAEAVGADTVVLVNSASAKFLDFRNYIQPYLNHLGVPYAIQDIATNPPGTNLSRYALIIIGHAQFDTNNAFLTPSAQASLSACISNGTGLVNFDGNLWTSGGAARYQFVQNLFAFGFTSGATAGSVTFVATEPGPTMHFVASRHTNAEAITLRSNLTVTGVNLPANAKAPVIAGGRPLIAVWKSGSGRAVQWLSYDWMASSVLGPISGMDDLVWRGFVWAARKPFVLRGLPNFVTLRVDDVQGPLWWATIAGQVGFRPWIGPFLAGVSPSSAAELRNLVTNGIATSSAHAFCGFDFLFWDHSSATNWPDDVISNKMFLSYQWYQTNGIPISKVAVAHYSEMGPNVFQWFKNWGVEFLTLKNDPGTPRDSAWLVAGPYRLYEPRQLGSIAWPVFYADFLNVPGHPEFAGQFFNCVSEIRDATCGEWCPYDNIAWSAARGTQQLKQALDGMALATLFTHEWAIQPISCTPSSQTIATSDWLSILQVITNNLAAYQPVFVTMDYACQYIRATRTGPLLAADYDPASGQLHGSFAGYTDVPLQVQVFLGQDNAISNIIATVPPFSNPLTVTLTSFAPVLSGPAVSPPNGVFSFSLTGISNFNYRIDTSTDLFNWGTVTSLPNPSGTLQFADPNGTNLPQRFYRAVWTP